MDFPKTVNENVSTAGTTDVGAIAGVPVVLGKVGRKPRAKLLAKKLLRKNKRKRIHKESIPAVAEGFHKWNKREGKRIAKMKGSKAFKKANRKIAKQNPKTTLSFVNVEKVKNAVLKTIAEHDDTEKCIAEVCAAVKKGLKVLRKKRFGK